MSTSRKLNLIWPLPPLPRALELLQHATLDLQGIVPWSTNRTLVVTLREGPDETLGIYKPERFEQPLWDFPAHSLGRREVATFLLAHTLGWPSVPPVVLREGPLGPGSLQLYIAHDPQVHFFTLREGQQYRVGLQRIALFDQLINNADRKGGHLLLDPEGHVWAIDHGLTFHAEPKLRTVIWDYAGEPLPPAERSDLLRLQADLAPGSAPSNALAELLKPFELDALRERLSALLQDGIYPLPNPNQRCVPYPLI